MDRAELTVVGLVPVADAQTQFGSDAVGSDAMDIRRATQLASLIVIINGAVALLLSPQPAAADTCMTNAFCDIVPCNTEDDYRQLCRVILQITCPCRLCEAMCTNVGTCGPGTLGWVTCIIGGPLNPCP